MLRWAIIFLVIAIIAGLLGFNRVSGAAGGISKFLFLIILIIVVLAFLFASRLF